MLPRLVKIWWVGAGDFLLLMFGCKATLVVGSIKTSQLQGFYFKRHDTGKQ